MRGKTNPKAVLLYMSGYALVKRQSQLVSRNTGANANDTVVDC